jgi:hypothetical protein
MAVGVNGKGAVRPACHYLQVMTRPGHAARIVQIRGNVSKKGLQRLCDKRRVLWFLYFSFLWR